MLITAKMISWLIDSSVDRKQRKTKTKNTKDLLFLCVLCDNKLIHFGFWTADEEKEAIWRRQLGVKETVVGIFNNLFDIFITKNELFNKEIN